MNRARLLPNFPRLGVAVYIDLFNYYRSKFGKRVFDDSPIREGQILVTGTVEKAVEKLRKQDPTLPTKTRFYDLRKDRNKRHEEVQDPNTLILWCGREKHPPRDGRILDRDEDGTFSAGRAFDIPSRIVEHWQTHYRKTFCSISGIKLTPKGVFNVMPVECSEECRTGRIVEKVTPDDFKVVKLEKIDNPLLSLDISPWQYLLLE